MKNDVTAFTVTVFPNGVSTAPGWRFKKGILMTPQTYDGEPIRFGIRSAATAEDEIQTRVMFDTKIRRCVEGSLDGRIGIALMIVGNLYATDTFVQNGTIQSLMRNMRNEYRVAMISLSVDTPFDFSIGHAGQAKRFRLQYDSVNGDISLTNRDLHEVHPMKFISRLCRLIIGKQAQTAS